MGEGRIGQVDADDVDADESELRARVSALEDALTIVMARLELLGRRVAGAGAASVDERRPTVRLRAKPVVQDEPPPLHGAPEGDAPGAPGRYALITTRRAPRG